MQNSALTTVMAIAAGTMAKGTGTIRMPKGIREVLVFAALFLIPRPVMPLAAQPQSPTLPPMQLRTFMATSGKASHPEVKVTVPGDYLLISGGCRDNWSGWGNLLVASYPESPNTWVCIGKDHAVADPSTIDGFAVAIYDPNHAWSAMIQSRTSGAADWPQATVTLPAGYTLTGGGGNVHYKGWGNMLTASMPNGTTGWTAKAKDHGVADPSTLTVYAIGIRPNNGAIMPAVTIFQNRSAAADHPATSVGVSSGYTLLGCGAFADWHGAGQLLTATYPSTRSECSAKSKDHINAVEVASVVAYAIAVPIDPSQGPNKVVSSSGQAVASQTAVLRVERDIFRNGGWGFRWVSPNPKGDGYSYGDAALQLKFGDVIPPGSKIISAVLNYNFGNLAATTSDTRPTAASELGGHAKAPRDHGSNNLCSFGTPASVDHWGPAAAFFANRVQLGGQNTYSFPGSPASPSGSTGTGVASITRVPGVFNAGLGSTDDIRQLIYNKASGFLYAATAGGVFRSNNQAAGWTSLNSGLPYLLVNRIAVSPDGTRLFAGTNGGIYALTKP